MIIFRKWFLVVPWLPFRCFTPFRKANSWNLNPSYCQMLWGLFISSVPGAFGSAACEEQCLQCKRQGTIDGSGAAWRCGFVDAAVVTIRTSTASEGNLYSPKLYYFNISVTWKLGKHGDTQRPGEDTCNMHQVLLHIISLHPNRWSYPGFE